MGVDPGEGQEGARRPEVVGRRTEPRSKHLGLLGVVRRDPATRGGEQVMGEIGQDRGRVRGPDERPSGPLDPSGRVVFVETEVFVDTRGGFSLVCRDRTRTRHPSDGRVGT